MVKKVGVTLGIILALMLATNPKLDSFKFEASGFNAGPFHMKVVKNINYTSLIFLSTGTVIEGSGNWNFKFKDKKHTYIGIFDNWFEIKVEEL